LDSSKDGEHFSDPHGASSTPTSRAMGAAKIKILKKNFFFQNFSSKIKNLRFLTPFVPPYTSPIFFSF